MIFSKRLKVLWERAKKQISESESRVRSESQLIHGEEFDVWRWIQPRSPSSPSPQRKKRAVSLNKQNKTSEFYEESSFRNHHKVQMKKVMFICHPMLVLLHVLNYETFLILTRK